MVRGKEEWRTAEIFFRSRDSPVCKKRVARRGGKMKRKRGERRRDGEERRRNGGMGERELLSPHRKNSARKRSFVRTQMEAMAQMQVATVGGGEGGEEGGVVEGDVAERWQRGRARRKFFSVAREKAGEERERKITSLFSFSRTEKLGGQSQDATSPSI